MANIRSFKELRVWQNTMDLAISKRSKTVLTKTIITGIVGFLAIGAVSAGETADKTAPISPEQVQLTGWLGRRVEANWKNRLMTVSLEERLRAVSEQDRERGLERRAHRQMAARGLDHVAVHARPRPAEAHGRGRGHAAGRPGLDGYLGTYAPRHRWGGWDVWCHKYNLIGLLAYAQTYRRSAGPGRRPQDRRPA